MSEPSTYSIQRYLQAKKSIDARALNHRVGTRFLDELHDGPTSPLRILEIGGGIGATAERTIAGLEDRSADALYYTLVDIDPGNVEAAAETLQGWAHDRGFNVVTGPNGQVWTGRSIDVTIRFVTADLFDFAAAHDGPFYDAIIAQAVLDLLPVPETLRALGSLFDGNGLWYLPLHFDGVTAFEPSINPALDARIERLYHESMGTPTDGREGQGGAHCGRRLLTHLRNAGASLMEAGSSDWVIFARESEYSDDEAYFLHHILHFVETELSGHPALEPDAFAEWLHERHRQIEAGSLIYVTHQLDVLARHSSENGPPSS